MKIFGREPAVIIGAIQALLAFAISFGWLAGLGLNNQHDIGLVMAIVSALAALYLAYATSETLLAPLIELFKAGAALAVIYNFQLSTDQTASVIAAITMLAAFFQRTQTSPLATGSFDLNTPKAA